MNQNWLIYGATGYSAKLIIKEAKKRGLSPILSGRNKDAIETLAAQEGLPSRVFDLSDVTAIAKNLQDVELVLHCAGPFSKTSKVMIEACIQSKTHYFDITGEIEVFEHAHSKDINARAKAANIVVCPGVGFDVVPTDCIAATLKKHMPDASHLSLAFAGGTSLSPGTAKTTVESLGLKPKVRSEGVIQGAALRTKIIDYGNGRGPLTNMNISWGDVSTAYYSTQIPNVDVYIPASPRMLKKVKRSYWLKPLLQNSFVQKRIKAKIEQSVRGPDEEKRAKQTTVVWGQVKNREGKVTTARVETPNGYDVTVTAPLGIIDKMLNSPPQGSGSITPSALMGADYVTTLSGVSDIEIFTSSST